MLCSRCPRRHLCKLFPSDCITLNVNLHTKLLKPLSLKLIKLCYFIFTKRDVLKPERSRGLNVGLNQTCLYKSAPGLQEDLKFTTKIFHNINIISIKLKIETFSALLYFCRIYKKSILSIGLLIHIHTSTF